MLKINTNKLSEKHKFPPAPEILINQRKYTRVEGIKRSESHIFIIYIYIYKQKLTLIDLPKINTVRENHTSKDFSASFRLFVAEFNSERAPSTRGSNSSPSPSLSVGSIRDINQIEI